MQFRQFFEKMTKMRLPADLNCDIVCMQLRHFISKVTQLTNERSEVITKMEERLISGFLSDNYSFTAKDFVNAAMESGSVFSERNLSHQVP